MNRKITAYGGFSLLAAFFEKIKLRENLEEMAGDKRCVFQLLQRKQKQNFCIFLIG